MRVLVRNLAGEELELELPSGSRAADVKQQLAKRWPYPAECFQLLNGAVPVSDAEPLQPVAGAALAADGPPPSLALTAVVSLEELRRRAAAASAPQAARSAALQALADVAPPEDGGSTLRLAAACLEAQEPEVRRAASRALLRLSQRGHTGVTAAVVARLRARDPAVRVAVALALLQVAPRGDETVAEAMAGLMDDSDAEVRRIALHVLTQSFDRGDQRLVAMARARLQEARSVRTCGLCDLLWSTPADALELFHAGLALFLDARDEEAFATSRIFAALSMPGHTPEQLRRLQATPAFDAIHADTSKVVIIYSDSGAESSRCAWVARTLRESPGVQAHRILRLAGGLNLWKQQGFPVEGSRTLMYAGRPLA